MSSGNRISTLQNGADQAFGFNVTVSPGSGNNSPVTSNPPIIFIPIDTVWSYTIASADSNGNTLTFSLPDPSGGGIYGTWTQLAGLTIDPNTGALSLNTAGFTVGNQYSAVVEITDGFTTIASDFILEVVAELELPVITSDGVDFCIFSGFIHTNILSAILPTSPSTSLTWAVLSASIDNLVITQIDNTLTLVFTPTDAQNGEVHIINLSVINPLTGAITYLNLTYTIKDPTIDDIITLFNTTIKDVGVECNRLDSLNLILCYKETQYKIWEKGQETSDEQKKKLG